MNPTNHFEPLLFFAIFGSVALTFLTTLYLVSRRPLDA